MYRIEKESNGSQAIVIDGFENGIASSPYSGIASIKNMNISFLPGATYVNYRRLLASTTANTGTYTADAAADTITPSFSPFLIYDAFTVSVTEFGLTAGTVYFKKTSGGQVSLTLDGAAVNITSSGTSTGTMTMITMGYPKYWTQDSVLDDFYLVDKNNRVWTTGVNVGSNGAPNTSSTVSWRYLTGYTPSSGDGEGICCYKGFIFVFSNTKIDYNGTLGSNVHNEANWHVNWQSGLENTEHYAIWAADDDKMYFCNGRYIGSISQVGTTPFDPAGVLGVDYDINLQALDLPSFERETTWLTELRTNLLISAGNRIYPWDKISDSYNNSIPIKETIVRMINIFNNVYILAGTKGNIYISNGYSCSPWIKIPDSFFNAIDPRISWGDCMAHRNRLYVGVRHAAGNSSDLCGIMSIDINTQAINYENQSSTGQTLNVSSPSTLVPANILINNNEDSTYDTYLSSFFGSGGNSGGMDGNSQLLYISNEPEIQTDLIPVGTFANPVTFSSIEFKLDSPLKTGDSITVYGRQSLADSWTQLGTTTTTILSDFYTPLALQKWQWLQLKVNVSCRSGSETSNIHSSFVRIREIRVR